jgi:16S rRNA A1518/A1519 N6-dimethyltransferase RsmA/KsgA/DIM1 with predicted DNA glycosylase/AP lyase activity
MKRLANYSQNFIRNPRLVSDLVGLTNISKNDIVYDIGAGSGVISSVLAEKCKSVIAVEFEPRAAAKLRENMEKYPNVSVYEGDFLTMPLPKGLYKIFANIPFHLSSPIVRKIIEADNPPEATYLIVQKQFGEKLLSNSAKFTGQLGMMIGPGFVVKIRKNLQRTDFWPHPNVDTVFIEIIRRPELLIEKHKMPVYCKFISDCFSDPKKFTKTPRDKIGLPFNIRPSQMKLEQWIDLFTAWKK